MLLLSAVFELLQLLSAVFELLHILLSGLLHSSLASYLLKSTPIDPKEAMA